MGIEIIFLILAVLVIAFGVGVVVLNRRREGVQPPSQRTAGQPAAPPRPADDPSTGDTLVQEPAVAEEPPAGTLRERLAKARSTFAGAISGVLSRSAITD
ncbi:MAG: signal recognition particle-docking protein FtsY, partial [Ilumatobacter sp.]|nr:signal recognition particle-docking protein FtsY [Ilumatobacter sp.]